MECMFGEAWFPRTWFGCRAWDPVQALLVYLEALGCLRRQVEAPRYASNFFSTSGGEAATEAGTACARSKGKREGG